MILTKKQKGFLSIGVFLVLFSGAWYASEFNQRTIHSKGYDGIEQIRILQGEQEAVPITTPFKPREYIRIGSRRISAEE